ncbi:MAG: hypothetical protein U0Z70_06425 [Thermomicrobiales bacterium]
MKGAAAGRVAPVTKRLALVTNRGDHAVEVAAQGRLDLPRLAR